MNRGFHLTLMVGSFNASPVPQPVIDALTDVQVTTAMGSQGGFQLKFTIGRNSAFAQIHQSGFFEPRRRVIVAATVNGLTEVLMDGIVTKQDLTPSSAAGKSTLTITGLDLTALMDFIDLTGIPYPAMPTFAIVELILAKYLVLGIKPIAIPPLLPRIADPTEEIPTQIGTDYSYVTTLARAVGAVFYLDPGPVPGQSMAYWGPDLTRLFGDVQPALSIDFDGTSNLDSLSFSYDGTLAATYAVTIIEPITKLPIPIPIPQLDLIKPSLAANKPSILKFSQLTPTASENPVKAALTGLGKMFDTADVVSGSGQLDVMRYGRILRLRQLCGVRGGGPVYDGLYYVKGITHTIKRGEYKQSFQLARGGTGSTVGTLAA